MAAYNVILRVCDGTNYDNEIYMKTKPGNVDGLLGADGKIKTAWFPSYMFGDLKYIGTIDDDTSLTALEGVIGTWLTNNGLTAGENKINMIGKFFMVTTNGATITLGSNNVFDVRDDSTLPTDEQVLEAGDWVVFNSYDAVTETSHWGIVNNKYADATSSTKGVVKLATLKANGDVDSSSGHENDVITITSMVGANVKYLNNKQSSAFMEKTDYLSNDLIKDNVLSSNVGLLDRDNQNWTGNKNTFGAIDTGEINASGSIETWGNFKMKALESGAEGGYRSAYTIKRNAELNATAKILELELPNRSGTFALLGDVIIPIVDGNELAALPKQNGFLAFLEYTPTYNPA